MGKKNSGLKRRLNDNGGVIWTIPPTKEQKARCFRVLCILGTDNVPHGVIDRIAIKIEGLENRIKELEKKL